MQTTNPILRSMPSILIRPSGGAAIVLAIGSFLTFMGLGWDIQWHTDVGPDTFFTMPHLVFYSGIALAGLACLAGIVRYLWDQRAENGLRARSFVVDAWRAPVGFIIGGIGAAVFLVYGFFDLWWHSVYGFDATVASPPHIGLLIGAQTTILGAVTVFAGRIRAIRGRIAWSGPVFGLLIALTLAVAESVPFQVIMPERIFGFSGYTLTIAVMYPLVLLTGAGVVRRPGAATLLSILFAFLRLVTAYFTLSATPAYATSLGLFMRDDSSTLSAMADAMPATLLLAGPLVDFVLVAARRRGISVRAGVVCSGAIAGLLLAWLHRPEIVGLPAITSLFDSAVLPTLVLTPLLGALGGWLGWQLGAILRQASAAGVEGPAR